MTRRVLRSTLFECGKPRPIVLEIENGVACLRPKGLRKRVYFDPAAIWQRGIKAEVEAERKKRRKRR